MDTTLKIGALIAAVTWIVEIIKSLVPAHHKSEQGLLFPRKGKSTILIPNQAAWPILSALVGMGLFLLTHYDPLGFGGYVGQAVSGFAVGTPGGAAAFRTKTKLGNIFGGTDATDALHTGPTTIPPPEDPPTT